MSSLIRRIQMSIKRNKYYMGRGSKLGVRNTIPKLSSHQRKMAALRTAAEAGKTLLTLP